MTIITFVKNHKKDIIYLLIICIIIAISLWLYNKKNTAQTVTTESQIQAETPAGVEQAANNAQINISPDQAQQAADQIKYINTSGQQPGYIVYTTVAQAPAAEKTAQEKASADFAIVTDTQNPNQQVDLTTLPADNAVTLNQYNIQAYKKVLRTVSYAPKTLKNWEPKQVGASVAKKVTDDGQYIGAGIDYNFDDDSAIVKLEYTW